MALKIGSLFSGYGGLDLAVQSVYDAEHAWFCEFDPAPSKILAHHWPDIQNLHDITAVDWLTVEPIDILTGGFPCQDVSTAGKRAGMTEGTRSGLWSHMAHAIDVLRPQLVVIENVGGLFSAQANRFMEPCPHGLGGAGGGGHAVLLRAADAVLGDLASIGYDAEWVALRASDVGAPHGRLRVFITAHPQGERGLLAHGDGGTTPALDREGDLLPTPRTTDMNGPGAHGAGGMDLRTAVTLLPTPTAQAAKHAGDDRGPGTLDDHNLWAVVTRHDCFGSYAPAIQRWEQVMGRPAPDPTEPGKNRPRLSARFVEWMMGLDDGHVTGVGLTRSQQLKALGNGVVPQQGAAALAHLHHVRKAA